MQQKKLSVWQTAIIIVLIALGIGYALGVRTNINALQALPQPMKTVSYTPTPTPYGDDGDIDYTSVSGVIKTNTTYYDQILIIIDQWQNGVTTKAQYDTRVITHPQVGVNYPYDFSRLLPGLTYLVSFFACHHNANNTMQCTDTAKITTCSGEITNNSCLVNDSGIVNFSVIK